MNHRKSAAIFEFKDCPLTTGQVYPNILQRKFRLAIVVLIAWRKDAILNVFIQFVTRTNTSAFSLAGQAPTKITNVRSSRNYYQIYLAASKYDIPYVLEGVDPFPTSEDFRRRKRALDELWCKVLVRDCIEPEVAKETESGDNESMAKKHLRRLLDSNYGEELKFFDQPCKKGDRLWFGPRVGYEPKSSRLFILDDDLDSVDAYYTIDSWDESASVWTWMCRSSILLM
jgi:hypothetical protein